MFGISEKKLGARQIDKSFVDGNLIDVGRIFAEYIHDSRGDFVIALMSSVQVDARRAEPVGFGDGHSRVDAVYARFVGCRRNDSPPLSGQSSDDHGFSAESGVVELFDGSEKGVDIDVKKALCHEKPPLFCAGISKVYVLLTYVFFSPAS